LELRDPALQAATNLPYHCPRTPLLSTLLPKWLSEIIACRAIFRKCKGGAILGPVPGVSAWGAFTARHFAWHGLF
jgi:hypothetical protein